MGIVLLPPLSRLRGQDRLLARLSRARRLEDLPPGRAAQLEALFAVGPGELVAAAAACDGLERERRWVACAPVSLLVDPAAVRLIADPVRLELAEAEARALFATVARWCAGSGLEARYAAPERWYLALGPDWEPVEAEPPERWLGADLRGALPGGPQAGRWRRLVAELEMLLATEPVNERRRAQGRLPANSVWLWGSARASPPRAPGALCRSDDPLLRALAASAGMRVLPLGGHDPARESAMALLDLASLPPASLGPPVPAEWWLACGRRYRVGRLDRLAFWRRRDAGAEPQGLPGEAP